MENYTLTEINNGIKLYQPHGGLAFGTDALLLASFVRRQKNASCVELGSGTGVISLLMLARGKIRCTRGIEIQPDYYEVSKLNAEVNGMTDRFEPILCDAVQYSTTERYDVVYSNPPYLEVTGKESPDIKRDTARREISGGIADFSAAAAKLLRYGGLFCVVYRPERLTELMYSMRSNKIEPKRLTMVYEDTAHTPCLVLVEGRLGGAPGLYATPPFFIRSADGGYSDEYKYQIENGDFDERYYCR